MWRDAVRRSATDGNRSDPRALLVVAAALSETYGPAAVDAAPAVLGVFAEQAESPAPPIAHATVRASSPESSLPPLAAPASESSQRATQSQSSEIASLRSGEAPPQTIPSAWRSTRHAGLLFLIPAFSATRARYARPAAGRSAASSLAVPCGAAAHPPGGCGARLASRAAARAGPRALRRAARMGAAARLRHLIYTPHRRPRGGGR